MLDRLGARYPVTDHSVRVRGDRYLEGSYDAGYSGAIEIAGRTLGFHVSLLGPYYGIHCMGALIDEPAALDLAQEIEATYPGYEPIPLELGNEVVPDVCLDTRNFGRVTIYHCLLAEVWGWSWGPTTARSCPSRGAATWGVPRGLGGGSMGG